jgi:molybdate transport system substrate-binding protein
VKKIILSAIVVGATLLFGCGSHKSGESGSTRTKLLLYCGAGIRPPVQEIVETFEREQGVKMDIDFEGSNVLLSKIELAHKGDLYMPGDKHYIDQAAAEGMILSDKPACYFVPTILVQKGNPKNIHDLKDLLRADVKLGIGDPNACAVGRKTKKIFAKNNIPWADVEKNVAFQSLTVNELGMQVQARSLDAVIVWDAIARYYKTYGDMVPIPRSENIISTIDVGVLLFTKHKELAQKFVDFVTSQRGGDIFRKHFYTVKLPEQ